MKPYRHASQNSKRKLRGKFAAALAIMLAGALGAPIAITALTPSTAAASVPIPDQDAPYRGRTPGFAPPFKGNQVPGIESNCTPRFMESALVYRDFCYPKHWFSSEGNPTNWDYLDGNNPVPMLSKPRLMDMIDADKDRDYRHWDFVTPEYDDTYNPGYYQGYFNPANKNTRNRGMQNVYLSAQAYKPLNDPKHILFVFHMKGRVPAGYRSDEMPAGDYGYFRPMTYQLQLATGRGLKALDKALAYNRTDNIRIYGRESRSPGQADASHSTCFSTACFLSNHWNTFANSRRFDFFPLSVANSGFLGFKQKPQIVIDGKYQDVQSPARIQVKYVAPGADLYVVVRAEIDGDLNDPDGGVLKDVDRFQMRARASVNPTYNIQGKIQGHQGADFDMTNFAYPNDTWFFREYSNEGSLDPTRKTHRSVLAEVGISKMPEQLESDLYRKVGYQRSYPYLDETTYSSAARSYELTPVDTYGEQSLTKNGMRLNGVFVEDKNTAENASRDLIIKQEYEDPARIEKYNRQRPTTDLIETSEGNYVINVAGKKKLRPALQYSTQIFDNTREYTDSFTTMNVDTVEGIAAEHERKLSYVNAYWDKQAENVEKENYSSSEKQKLLEEIQRDKEAELSELETQYKRDVTTFKTDATKGLFNLNLRVQGKDHKNDKVGDNYIFVLDTSGSMNWPAKNDPEKRTKLEVLKSTLTHAIGQLTRDNAQTNNNDDSDPEARRNNRIGIITFGNTMWAWDGGEYHVGDTILSPNGEDAKKFISTITPGGNTNYIGAISFLHSVLDSLPKFQDSNWRRTQVVFISDGEPTVSYKLERVFYNQAGKPYPESTFETYDDFFLGASFYKSLQSSWQADNVLHNRFPSNNTARYSFLKAIQDKHILKAPPRWEGFTKIEEECTFSSNCQDPKLESLVTNGRYAVMNGNSYTLRPYYKTANSTLTPYTNISVPWCYYSLDVLASMQGKPIEDVNPDSYYYQDISLPVPKPYEEHTCVLRADRRYIPILDPYKNILASWSSGIAYSFGYNMPSPYDPNNPNNSHHGYCRALLMSLGKSLPDTPCKAEDVRQHQESWVAMNTLDLYGGVVHFPKTYQLPPTAEDPEKAKRIIQDNGFPTRIEIAQLRRDFPLVNFYAQAIPGEDDEKVNDFSGMSPKQSIEAMRLVLRDTLAGGNPEHYAETSVKNYDELFFKANYPETFQKRVNEAYIEYQLGDDVLLAVPTVIEAEKAAREAAAPGSRRTRRALSDPIRLVYGTDYTLDGSTSFSDEWKSQLDVVYNPGTRTVTVGQERKFDLGKYDWLQLRLKIQANPEKPNVQQGKYVMVAKDGKGAYLHTRGPKDLFSPNDYPPQYVNRFFVVPSVRAKPRFGNAELYKYDSEDLEDPLTREKLEGLNFTLTPFIDPNVTSLPESKLAHIGYAQNTPQGRQKVPEVKQADLLSLNKLVVGQPYELTETSAPTGYGLAKNSRLHIRLVEKLPALYDKTLPLPSGTTPEPAAPGKECDFSGDYSCSQNALMLQWRLPGKDGGEPGPWIDATTYTGQVTDKTYDGPNPASWLYLYFSDPLSKGMPFTLVKASSQLCPASEGTEAHPENGKNAYAPYCLLNGSEFKLFQDDDGELGEEIADGFTVDSEQEPQKNAVFKSAELASGIYWVAETKAPDGHQLLAEPVRVQFTHNGSKGTLEVLSGGSDLVGYRADFENSPTLVVQDVEVGRLPASGGRGVILSVLAGLLLLGAAIGFRRQAAHTEV